MTLVLFPRIFQTYFFRRVVPPIVGQDDLAVSPRAVAYGVAGAAPWFLAILFVQGLGWRWLLGPRDPEPLFLLLPWVAVLGILTVYLARRERTGRHLATGTAWAALGYVGAFLAWALFVASTVPQH